MARAFAVTLSAILSAISFAFGMFFTGVGGHLPTVLLFSLLVPAIVIGGTVWATRKGREPRGPDGSGPLRQVPPGNSTGSRRYVAIALLVLLIPLAAYVGMQILAAGVTP